MNSHKNARLTFEGRKLLIERIATMGLTLRHMPQGSAFRPLANGKSALPCSAMRG